MDNAEDLDLMIEILPMEKGKNGPCIYVHSTVLDVDMAIRLSNSNIRNTDYIRHRVHSSNNKIPIHSSTAHRIADSVVDFVDKIEDEYIKCLINLAL